MTKKCKKYMMSLKKLTISVPLLSLLTGFCYAQGKRDVFFPRCGRYEGIASLYMDTSNTTLTGVFETSASPRYEMRNGDYCRLLLVQSAKMPIKDSNVYLFKVFNISARDSMYPGGIAIINFLTDSTMSVRFDENVYKHGNMLPCLTEWPLDEEVILELAHPNAERTRSVNKTIDAQAISKQIEQINKAGEDCAHAGINSAIDCSQKLYNQADSILNVVYNSLKAQMAPTAFAQLKTEQKQWLKKRDANALELGKQARYNRGQADNEASAALAIRQKASFIEDRIMELLKKIKQ